MLVLTAVITASLLLSLIPPPFFSEVVERAFHGRMKSLVIWRFTILFGPALYVPAERILPGLALIQTTFGSLPTLRAGCPHQ